MQGCLLSGCSSKSHLRSDVPVAGQQMQQNSRNEEQKAVLYRCP